MIQREVGIAPDKQRLVLNGINGNQLENENTLWDYGLKRGDTINVVMLP